MKDKQLVSYTGISARYPCRDPGQCLFQLLAGPHLAACEDLAMNALVQVKTGLPPYILQRDTVVRGNDGAPDTGRPLVFPGAGVRIDLEDSGGLSTMPSLHGGLSWMHRRNRCLKWLRNHFGVDAFREHT